MKNIYLAKKIKRILARLLDMIIEIILTCIIFFSTVYPLSLDREKINKNYEEIIELYEKSGLFIVSSDGSYTAKCSFSEITTIEDLCSIDLTYKDTVYKDVSLTKSLYSYYTTLLSEYENLDNIEPEVYKKDILKIKTTESNIEDYDYDTNTLTLFDESNEETTVSFFLDIYQNACENLISNSKINTLTNENQQIVFSAALLIIPVLFIVTFVFELLIPLLMPSCETIGKKIFKLGLITKDGYRYKKQYLILRWLSYTVLELILGVFSMGASLLISYTMFLFTHNRRCIHDFISNSTVIDTDRSIYFSNAEEENYYNSRKTSGDING